MHCQVFFGKLFCDISSLQYMHCKVFFCKLFVTSVHYSTCIARYFSVNYIWWHQFTTVLGIFLELFCDTSTTLYAFSSLQYSTGIDRYFSVNYISLLQFTKVHALPSWQVFFCKLFCGHQFTTVHALPGIFLWTISWHQFTTVHALPGIFLWTKFRDISLLHYMHWPGIFL